MRTTTLVAGALLMLFPINWFRLIVTGEIPADGPSVAVAFVASLFVFGLAGAMIWYGLNLNAATAGLSSTTSPQRNASHLESGTQAGILRQIIETFIRPFREAKARREAEKARQAAELAQARMGELAPIDAGFIVLKAGEKAFASIKASMMEMRTVGYKGGSTGVSVRVAKGVYLRQSGLRGTPQRGLVATATGILVATDKRIVFAGDQKSAAVPYDKLASFQPLFDGLRFSNGSKTFTFLTGRSLSQQLFLTIAQRLLHQRPLG